MAYTRYRLRGRLLRILEKLPTKLTPGDLAELYGLVEEIERLYREFCDAPFEYVRRATIDEHGKLSAIFARLLPLARDIVLGALAAFRGGALEFELDSRIIELREQLTERAQGQSVTAALLADLHKGGERSDSE